MATIQELKTRANELHATKYKILYDTIIKICNDSNGALKAHGFYGLNLKYDDHRKYDPHYVPTLLTREAYMYGIILSNELDRNNLNIRLITIKLHEQLALELECYRFHKLCYIVIPNYNISDRFTDLAFLYRILLDVSKYDLWTEALSYHDRVYDGTMNNFKTDRVDRFLPKEFNTYLNMLKTKNFILLGELAYFLTMGNGKYYDRNLNVSIPTFTALSLIDVESIILPQDGTTRTIKRFNEEFNNVQTLYINHPNFVLIILDFPKFIPIHTTIINGYKIANPNVMCYFAITFRQYHIIKHYKRSVGIMPLNINEYEGNYVNLLLKLKRYYLANNVKLASYNPKEYKQKNGDYKTQESRKTLHDSKK